MNKVVLMGRLVENPNVNDAVTCARYTLAVDRRYKREGEPTADFISCKVIGKSAEFVNNHLKKGTKVTVSGHIETGSYTNKEGAKVYTTDVIVEEHEFAESKRSEGVEPGFSQINAPIEFTNIPDGMVEELPFN